MLFSGLLRNVYWWHVRTTIIHQDSESTDTGARQMWPKKWSRIHIIIKYFINFLLVGKKHFMLFRIISVYISLKCYFFKTIFKNIYRRRVSNRNPYPRCWGRKWSIKYRDTWSRNRKCVIERWLTDELRLRLWVSETGFNKFVIYSGVSLFRALFVSTA